jgi:hypothetical protein
MLRIHLQRSLPGTPASGATKLRDGTTT